uniref:TSA: Wollemia nobilis Ref_Wollemi_Transcript_2512_2353 transcribed RNA sequence n=1 Tax=Wollemia nobilis TaxID=56998 RepID=A0A0C9SAL5_9CONI
MASITWNNGYVCLVLLSLILIAAGTGRCSRSSPPLLGFHGRRTYSGRARSYFILEKKVSEEKHPLLEYETRNFSQILDHFTYRPEGYKVFQQKYLINDKHWGGAKNNSPIFVYMGNEGNIEWFADNTGFMFESAPKFRALLVFIEHRFYGSSMPFGDKNSSYQSAETLGYLNSQQALADYATFIIQLKKNLSAEASPVVVFGGSYGGMLAAWFRLKYPHVAIAAVASSAPILHFDNIVPQNTFYDIVSNDFKQASQNCFNVIKESWSDLQAQSIEEGGLQKISKTFRTCKDLKSVDPVKDWLDEAFIYTAMTNYPTETNFLMPLPAHPVTAMCEVIDSFPQGTDTLSRVSAAASIYYNYSNTESCFQMESESDPHGLSGWGWQACTEMVMPMNTSADGMFPPSSYDFTEYEHECQREYGVKPRPHWITTEFGGSNISTVLKRFGSNIIFSNGLVDPWSGGGVLKNISKSLIALVTEKGAHHVDFRFSTSEDPDWLVEQRRREVQLINEWLQEYYSLL